MCNSRRTFETGFIARALPWTAWFTRGVNLSGLWARYGIFPIENHLFSRPLISLAEELRASHGDLAARGYPAGRNSRVARRMNGLRIGDLWKLEHFMARQGWVKVAQLKQPYRREVLENLRADDAARHRRHRGVRCGPARRSTSRRKATSARRPHAPDARRHRRGARAASPTCGCAPSRTIRSKGGGSRDAVPRGQAYPASPTSGRELAAARPMTTSALLAPFLRDGPETFAARRCRARRARTFGGFAARQRIRGPRTARAIRSAAVVNACSRRFAQTRHPGAEERRLSPDRPQPNDARFPHVADMIRLSGQHARGDDGVGRGGSPIAWCSFL